MSAPKAVWKREHDVWLLDAGWVQIRMHHRPAIGRALAGWVVELHMPWGETLRRDVHHVGGVVVDVEQAKIRAVELAIDAGAKMRERIDEAQALMPRCSVATSMRHQIVWRASMPMQREPAQASEHRVAYEQVEGIHRRTWQEMHDAGLTWLVNTVLHPFGWALVRAYDENGNFIEAFPAQLDARGFDVETNADGVTRLTEWMVKASPALLREVTEQPVEEPLVVDARPDGVG